MGWFGDRMSTVKLRGHTPFVRDRIPSRRSIAIAFRRDVPNHFDAIRLVAALAVIVDHAALFAGQSPLVMHGFSVGYHAVNVFFVISGFLLANSLLPNRLIGDYVRARVLRLWPALTLCALLTAFVLAPLITTAPRDGDFLSAAVTYVYHVVTFNGMSDRSLPGVFETARYPVVNGSLWTLPYEVLCYVALALLALLEIHRRGIGIALVAGLVGGALMALPEDWPSLRHFWSFTIGVLLWRFRERIVLSWRAAILSIATLVVVAVNPWWPSEHWPASVWVPYSLAQIAVLGYVVMWLAFLDAPRVRWLAWAGDPSYGTYIYGWPVLNVAAVTTGSFAATLAIGLLVAPVLGILSWHLLEKRALQLNADIRKRYRAGATPPQGAASRILWAAVLLTVAFVIVVPLLDQPPWSYVAHHGWKP